MAQSEMDYMNIGKGNLIGIDASNVIVPSTTPSSAFSYTATEDCWVRVYCSNTASNTTGYVMLDTYAIFGTTGAYNYYTIPLKKGQTLTSREAVSGITYSYMVFGIKY